ncbi:Crp/Fnr family transcriptional regulator [Haloechinothrix halophila]|uniref:Crp/Fnr family transcriptional regulator n=1 Tax=Haloechinothrix halophila TaxID=1069073 RepID=UPI0003FB7751
MHRRGGPVSRLVPAGDGCKTIEARLCGTLCSLARRQPDEPVKLTHQQLASLVGASRERTTTALGQLVRHDLVAVRRGKITIRDFTALRRYAEGSHRVTRTTL